MALADFWNDPRVEARIAANLGRDPVVSNDEIFPLNLPDFDVCSRMLAIDAITELEPDVVVNASGINLVDWLEPRGNTAMNVHVHAVANLKTAVERAGALLVQFGCGEVFYRESLSDVPPDFPGFSESDEPNPASVYAKTKLESERVAREASDHLVLRLSSLFGETSEYSSGNLVASLINSLSRTTKISVLSDRVMEPLWSIDVLCALKTLLARGVRGLCHLSGGSRATPKEVAERFFWETGHRKREVVGISSKDYGEVAPRSAFTVLRSETLGSTEGVYRIPDWRTALRDYLDWRQGGSIF